MMIGNKEAETQQFPVANHTFRQSALNVVRAYRAGRGLSKWALPLWVAAYSKDTLAHAFASNRRKVFLVHEANHDLSIALRCNPSDISVLREVFLDRSYEFPYPINRHDPTIVDLGANIGLASAFLQAKYPYATIICVEPLNENVGMIRLNCELGKFTWKIEPSAVSDAIGAVKFFASEWWGSGSIVPRVGLSRQSSPNRYEHAWKLPIRSVNTITMAELIRKYSLEFIDILKIDIEGAEADLILNATGWIEKVGSIAIEIHDKYVDGPVIRRALADRGFFLSGSSLGCEFYVRR
ncbi:FkbM family methyltransferase [Sulfobacillus thermosulfidooxidans]|nr:FkbM family methyltransferase [Sulfobacillus thermosulfidooxidans]